MADIFIIDAARTPIGSFCGSLKTFKAHELGGICIQEVLKRQSIDPSKVSEVILGQALTAGQGQNPARQAAMKGGIPYSVPAVSINQLCGSGLKSVILGCQAIKANDAELVICGGQESMSQAPHCVFMRNGFKMGNSPLIDSMINDGLTDAFHDIHMGVTAEKVAEMYKISREEQDLFAVKSQQKASVAIQSGYFKNEMIPVTVKSRTGETAIDTDEHPRSETTVEKLMKLKPAFKEDGTVTAGNASGINDGAAVVVIASSNHVLSKKQTPLAKIVAYAEAGVEPLTMGLGPIPAIKQVLKKAGWSASEVDLFELNEAFAAQSLAVIKELKLDVDKVNVNGGAIALGHPIGASGARVLVTLLHALKRTGGKKGIASLCIGGGMGTAIAIETVGAELINNHS